MAGVILGMVSVPGGGSASDVDGSTPARRCCSKTVNRGSPTARSLWARVGFWLLWSGLAEGMLV